MVTNWYLEIATSTRGPASKHIQTCLVPKFQSKKIWKQESSAAIRLPGFQAFGIATDQTFPLGSPRLDCIPSEPMEAHDPPRRSRCTFPSCKSQRTHRAPASSAHKSCTAWSQSTHIPRWPPWMKTFTSEAVLISLARWTIGPFGRYAAVWVTLYHIDSPFDISHLGYIPNENLVFIHAFTLTKMHPEDSLTCYQNWSCGWFP